MVVSATQFLDCTEVQYDVIDAAVSSTCRF